MEIRREAYKLENKPNRRIKGFRQVKARFVPPVHPAIIITS